MRFAKAFVYILITVIVAACGGQLTEESPKPLSEEDRKEIIEEMTQNDIATPTEEPSPTNEAVEETSEDFVGDEPKEEGNETLSEESNSDKPTNYKSMSGQEPVIKESIPKPASNLPDTTIQVKPHKHETPKTHYVNMRVAYDRIMHENKEYTIGSYLYNDEDEEKILKEIAESKNIQVETVENSSKIKVVEITSHYIIQIIYDKDDFELLSENAKITACFEGHRAIHEWRIKPIASGKNKTLTISVENIDEHGHRYTAIPSQVLSVNVKVDTVGIFGTLWRFLRDNPEYTLTSVIIPIVITIYKRRQKKKKKRIAEAQDNES